MKKVLGLVSILALLSACGGGNGNGPGKDPDLPPFVPEIPELTASQRLVLVSPGMVEACTNPPCSAGIFSKQILADGVQYTVNNDISGSYSIKFPYSQIIEYNDRIEAWATALSFTSANERTDAFIWLYGKGAGLAFTDFGIWESSGTGTSNNGAGIYYHRDSFGSLYGSADSATLLADKNILAQQAGQKTFTGKIHGRAYDNSAPAVSADTTTQGISSNIVGTATVVLSADGASNYKTSYDFAFDNFYRFQIDDYSDAGKAALEKMIISDNGNSTGINLATGTINSGYEVHSKIYSENNEFESVGDFKYSTASSDIDKGVVAAFGAK